MGRKKRVTAVTPADGDNKYNSRYAPKSPGGFTPDDVAEDAEDNEYELPEPPGGENTLTAEQLELIMQLVAVQSVTGKTRNMRAFIRSRLKQMPDVKFWTQNGNIYAVRGEADSYPAIVAHTDTVHSINYNVQPHRWGDTLFALDMQEMQRYGTGGDDKVGIWAALQALTDFPVIKAAFFRDEEGGCRGSRVADMQFFADVTFVLQADRRGRYDFTDSIMSTPMLTDAFKEAVKHIVTKHKRNYVSGGMTDVWALADQGLRVCGANMSCGYYDPHTSREIINLLHMQETYAFIYDLITEVGATRWPFENRAELAKKNNVYSAYGGGDAGGWSGEWYGSKYRNKADDAAKPPGAYVKQGDLWLPRETHMPAGPTPAAGTGSAFRTTLADYCDCGHYLALQAERDEGYCAACYYQIMHKPLPDAPTKKQDDATVSKPDIYSAGDAS